MLEWERRHAEACANQQTYYRDPETQNRVFTEVGLRQRGTCCGFGCRHCPWAHDGIAWADRPQRIQRPALLHGALPDRPSTVVAWSGGKDSYLALQSLSRQRAVVLLTTFDLASRTISQHELSITTIVDQARALNVPLIGVPIAPGQDYVERIEDALTLLQPVQALVFGDLHLETLRDWRCQALHPLVDRFGIELEFPLWHRPYDTLIQQLEDLRVEVRIASIPANPIPGLQVGQVFDRTRLASLPPEIDAFGEQGEFHTEVIATSLRPWPSRMTSGV